MIRAFFRRLFPRPADPRDVTYARWRRARLANDTRGQAEAAAENRDRVLRILRHGPMNPIHPENRK